MTDQATQIDHDGVLLRVLIYQDDNNKDFWAQCLEIDVMSPGSDAAAAIAGIHHALNRHMWLNEVDIDGLRKEFGPAPNEFYRWWEAANGK